MEYDRLRTDPVLIPRAASNKPCFYAQQWLKFVDAKGPGAAQADLFIHLGPRIVLFEFKLTRCQQAVLQLSYLYGPLLAHIFKVPISFVSVFKNPGRGFMPHPEAPETLREALQTPAGVLTEWHFLT